MIRRYAFEFVQIRGFPCDCNYPIHCDSQASDLPPTRMLQQELEGDQRSASTLESIGTKQQSASGQRLETCRSSAPECLQLSSGTAVTEGQAEREGETVTISSAS